MDIKKGSGANHGNIVVNKKRFEMALEMKADEVLEALGRDIDIYDTGYSLSGDELRDFLDGNLEEVYARAEEDIQRRYDPEEEIKVHAESLARKAFSEAVSSLSEDPLPSEEELIELIKDEYPGLYEKAVDAVLSRVHFLDSPDFEEASPRPYNLIFSPLHPQYALGGYSDDGYRDDLTVFPEDEYLSYDLMVVDSSRISMEETEKFDTVLNVGTPEGSLYFQGLAKAAAEREGISEHEAALSVYERLDSFSSAVQGGIKHLKESLREEEIFGETPLQTLENLRKANLERWGIPDSPKQKVEFDEISMHALSIMQNEYGVDPSSKEEMVDFLSKINLAAVYGHPDTKRLVKNMGLLMGKGERSLLDEVQKMNALVRDGETRAIKSSPEMSLKEILAAQKEFFSQHDIGAGLDAFWSLEEATSGVDTLLVVGGGMDIEDARKVNDAAKGFSPDGPEGPSYSGVISLKNKATLIPFCTLNGSGGDFVTIEKGMQYPVGGEGGLRPRALPYDMGVTETTYSLDEVYGLADSYFMDYPGTGVDFKSDCPAGPEDRKRLIEERMEAFRSGECRPLSGKTNSSPEQNMDRKVSGPSPG